MRRTRSEWVEAGCRWKVQLKLFFLIFSEEKLFDFSKNRKGLEESLNDVMWKSTLSSHPELCKYALLVMP